VKLAIQFQVVSDDGRNISFSGEFSEYEIQDWFERAALGVKTIFSLGFGPHEVFVQNATSIGNKIVAIKEARTHMPGGWGLKEAKDFVEGSRCARFNTREEAVKFSDAVKKVVQNVPGSTQVEFCVRAVNNVEI
jgi:hypothetical protein